MFKVQCITFIHDLLSKLFLKVIHLTFKLFVVLIQLPSLTSTLQVAVDNRTGAELSTLMIDTWISVVT